MEIQGPVKKEESEVTPIFFGNPCEQSSVYKSILSCHGSPEKLFVVFSGLVRRNQELQNRLREVEEENSTLRKQLKPKRKYVKKKQYPDKIFACEGCRSRYSSKVGLYFHHKKYPAHKIQNES